MKRTIKLISYFKFKKVIEEFILDNLSVPECRECNELCHSVSINEENDLKILYSNLIQDSLIKYKNEMV